MSDQLKEGDVVALNSGGPPMTIDYIDGQCAHCHWFAGLELRQGDIQLAALKLLNKKKVEP